MGDHGDVFWAQEIVVAVRDVDRRVLRVHAAEEGGEFGFGADSAIRPDSLQRAGALGLLHRLLAMDVVDAQGRAEGEDNTRGNGRYGTFNKDITRRDGCGTL